MRRPGQVVPKQELLEKVWGDDFEGDPNVVEVYIGYLRRKIDRPFGREDLETVRGRAGAAGPHGTCPDLPSSLLIPSSRTLQTTQRAEAERLRLSARSEELLACLHSMRQTMAHAQGQMALHVGTSGHNAQRADEERRAVQVGIKISYITFVDKE